MKGKTLSDMACRTILTSFIPLVILTAQVEFQCWSLESLWPRAYVKRKCKAATLFRAVVSLWAPSQLQEKCFLNGRCLNFDTCVGNWKLCACWGACAPILVVQINFYKRSTERLYLPHWMSSIWEMERWNGSNWNCVLTWFSQDDTFPMTVILKAFKTSCDLLGNNLGIKNVFKIIQCDVGRKLLGKYPKSTSKLANSVFRAVLTSLITPSIMLILMHTWECDKNKPKEIIR